MSGRSSDVRFVTGGSARMRELLDEARAQAQTKEPILLLGETGTGKERLAREIHEMSSRSKGPFVPLNCASLDPALAESELFGHAKGAFTGALARRPGLFRTADSGTLFLDEISDLALHIQVKILRAFEDPQIRAVGEDSATEVNVRILAATSSDVESAMRAGTFRRDLYHRFYSRLRVPPLRERREDIEPLTAHFLALHRGGEGFNRNATCVSESARSQLRSADWPGNVRDLENAVKIALNRTLATGVETLEVQHFEIPPSETHPSSAADAAVASLRSLAVEILDRLDESAGQPHFTCETIDEIARRHRHASLKRQLATIFLERFRGEEARRRATRYFGYTSAEGVRRFCQE